MSFTDGDRSRFREHFREYQRSGDPARRDELVESHLGLAVHLSRRFENRGIPVDDLRQVAAEGLIKAFDRFDPDRGVEFSTFATPTILGELKRHFRDRGWAVRVPRRIQNLNLRLNSVVGSLTQELGRSPTIAELALATRSSQEDVLEALEASQAYRSSSLGSPELGDDVTDLSGDPDSNERAMLRVENAAMLEDLLEQLEPRERLMMQLRYFEEMSQREISERLGISQMHVSRLLAKSLTRLRAALDGEES